MKTHVIMENIFVSLEGTCGGRKVNSLVASFMIVLAGHITYLFVIAQVIGQIGMLPFGKVGGRNHVS
jgi:hypothetical protein